MALQRKFNLPPPPNPDDDVNGYSWRDWFRQLRDYVVDKGSILWSQIDFTGSKLSDIQNRPHNVLQSIQGGNSTLSEYYHLSNVEYTDLTDGGNTTLHYHASDRDLANATGTLAVANGGTGQTSYTNGQLLIGNTTGNTLTKSTLTAGSGVTITNGTGSITISATGLGGDVVGPASATDNAIARFDGTTGKLIQNSPVTIDDAGNIISPDSIQFSGTPPVTQPIGTLWFDSSTDTLNLQQNAITQQIGEEIYVYGKASATISGQTILQAIYKTGVVGASGNITFAPTIAGITDPGAIIGVATEDIATNSFGRITNFGIVHGINTSGSTYGETWVDGQDIWYNPVTGGLTKTKPSAPNQKFQIGTVINAGPGGSGSFQVLLQPGSVLGGTDSNVEFGTLNTSDLIQYNGTYWTNVANTSVSVGTATNANNIKTVSTATNANYYLTFVDSDNGTAAYEAVYTDAGITYNPSTNSITSGVSGGTF